MAHVAAVASAAAPQPNGAEWGGESDAFGINATDEVGDLAGGFMGGLLRFPSSAPFDYSSSAPFNYWCGSPRRLGLASSHAELRTMAHTGKLAVAFRMLGR